MADDDDKKDDKKSEYSDLFGYPMYGGKPPHTKGSDTSEAAADSLTTLRITKLHTQILDHLRGCGKYGAIDEEAERAIPMYPDTYRPRRAELKNAGRVIDSHKKRLTKRRKEAVVWILPEFIDPYLANPMPAPPEPP